MLGINFIIVANFLNFNNNLKYCFFLHYFLLNFLELDSSDKKLNLTKKNTIRKRAYVSVKDKKSISDKNLDSFMEVLTGILFSDGTLRLKVKGLARYSTDTFLIH